MIEKHKVWLSTFRSYCYILDTFILVTWAQASEAHWVCLSEKGFRNTNKWLECSWLLLLLVFREHGVKLIPFGLGIENDSLVVESPGKEKLWAGCGKDLEDKKCCLSLWWSRTHDDPHSPQLYLLLVGNLKEVDLDLINIPSQVGFFEVIQEWSKSWVSCYIFLYLWKKWKE